MLNLHKLVLAGVLVLGGCSASTEPVTPDETAQDETSTPQPAAAEEPAPTSEALIEATPTPVPEPTPEPEPVTPLLVGATAINIVSAESGQGVNPTLSWEPVEGAALYRVVVLDDAGVAYWGSSGDAPTVSIPLGGPVIGANYSWSVSAFDSDGVFLAISNAAPISP